MDFELLRGSGRRVLKTRKFQRGGGGGVIINPLERKLRGGGGGVGVKLKNHPWGGGGMDIIWNCTFHEYTIILITF